MNIEEIFDQCETSNIKLTLKGDKLHYVGKLSQDLKEVILQNKSEIMFHFRELNFNQLIEQEKIIGDEIVSFYKSYTGSEILSNKDYIDLDRRLKATQQQLCKIYLEFKDKNLSSEEAWNGLKLRKEEI